jgi:GT2 family glycosyltransferase
VLFACGGSMLIDRSVFLDAGGFDEDFFAYFEDVDLGWRLNVLGHRVALAPNAVTYHKVHGTAGRWAFAPRLRLYERNALAMIYKNYSAPALARVLPAAIALSYARTLPHLGLDPQDYVLGRTPPAINRIPARVVSALIAVEDFATGLPKLSAKRAWIQQRRRRPDHELFPLFIEPFRLHEPGRYEEIAHALIEAFDIRSLFAQRECEPTHRSTIAVPETIATAPFVAPAAGDPRVSIVILTALGPTNLRACLTSIAGQDYPRECCEVIVVDNGSAEDPSPAVAQWYPGARVIRNAANLGFAVANNIGARAASGDFVVFLNDDTRVAPGWLRAMLATARAQHAVCVGARILDWDGEHIDFCGGSVNFEGKGFQERFGYPTDRCVTREAPILFACGAAMLIDRRMFLDLGGWDEGTFAYYEDVELGWRLWLTGHSVWLTPHATVYHLHNGTSGRWALAPRLRLYERNALRMLFTHLEEDTLARVLPAALILAVDRAMLRTAVHRGFDPSARIRRQRFGRLRHRAAPRRIAWLVRHGLSQQGARKELGVRTNLQRVGVRGLANAALYVAKEVLTGSFGSHGARLAYLMEHRPQSASFDAHVEAVPPAAAAELLGVRDFIDSLPELAARRAWLQARRRRRDAEILSRFGRWWLSPTSAMRQEAHTELTEDLIDALGISDWSGADRMNPA